MMPIFAERLIGRQRVLDPMAGTCKLTEIRSFGYEGEIYCNEIEPEWAQLGEGKAIISEDDAANLHFADDFFDAICTSPTYGNRMADHHNAMDGSKRNTYRHVLGRPLTEANTGQMQWGDSYKENHIAIWLECRRVLKPEGIFILNISDHIRKGIVIPVSDWHKETVIGMGFELVEELKIATRRLRYGANHTKRIDHENVFVFRRPFLLRSSAISNTSR